MTSAQHAEGRQFDPGWVYVLPAPAWTCLVGVLPLDAISSVELLATTKLPPSCGKFSCHPFGQLHQGSMKTSPGGSRRAAAKVASKSLEILSGSPRQCFDGCWGSALGGAGRGNRTVNRVSVSSGKNDLKRLAGSGFRGFNILEDASYRDAPSGAGADAQYDHCRGYPCTEDREWVLRHPRGWARPSGLGGNLGLACQCPGQARRPPHQGCMGGGGGLRQRANEVSCTGAKIGVTIFSHPAP